MIPCLVFIVWANLHFSMMQLLPLKHFSSWFAAKVSLLFLRSTDAIEFV